MGDTDCLIDGNVRANSSTTSWRGRTRLDSRGRVFFLSGGELGKTNFYLTARTTEEVKETKESSNAKERSKNTTLQSLLGWRLSAPNSPETGAARFFFSATHVHDGVRHFVQRYSPVSVAIPHRRWPVVATAVCLYIGEWRCRYAERSNKEKGDKRQQQKKREDKASKQENRLAKQITSSIWPNGVVPLRQRNPTHF